MQCDIRYQTNVYDILTGAEHSVWHTCNPLQLPRP